YEGAAREVRGDARRRRRRGEGALLLAELRRAVRADVTLQRFEVVLEDVVALLALERGGEPFGHRRVDARRLADRVGELGGVGSGQAHDAFRVASRLARRADADGRVRVHEVPVALV